MCKGAEKATCVRHRNASLLFQNRLLASIWTWTPGYAKANCIHSQNGIAGSQIALRAVECCPLDCLVPEKILIQAHRKCNRGETEKVMRLRLLGVYATLLLGCVVGAMAGGSSAGGGAQIAPTDNSSVSTYKVTDTSV